MSDFADVQLTGSGCGSRCEGQTTYGPTWKCALPESSSPVPHKQCRWIHVNSSRAPLPFCDHLMSIKLSFKNPKVDNCKVFYLKYCITISSLSFFAFFVNTFVIRVFFLETWACVPGLACKWTASMSTFLSTSQKSVHYKLHLPLSPYKNITTLT